MNYIITFEREFSTPITGIVGMGATEVSFHVSTCYDKQFAIDKARKINEEGNVNVQIERFCVWECKTQKFTKKSIRIYPSIANPLFL